MVESTHITIAYTIAVFMVRRFLGEDASEATVGLLTGLLVSVFISSCCVLPEPILN